MNVAASAFSGIGGLDLGLALAGFRHTFFCESEPYRRSILRKRWPGVPVYEDVRQVATSRRGRSQPGVMGGVGHGADGGRDRSRPEDGDAGVFIFAGGFPCQDVSVAGLRRGIERGERSNLFFEFCRIADAVVPDGGWILIENVPGLLSSNGGRDFAVVLASLAELGFHDLAWRILDSRYFGVPQRRRRVFILGRRSRGRSASEVLLEPESGGGDFETGRQARPDPAARAAGGLAEDGRVAATLGNADAGPDRGRRDDVDSAGAYPTYFVEDGENGTLRASNDGGRFDKAPLTTGTVAEPLTRGSSTGDTNVPGRRQEDDYNLVAGPITKRYGKGINTTVDDAALVSRPPEEADADGVRAPAGPPGRVDRALMFDASSQHGSDETGTGVPNMAEDESLGLTSRSDRYAVAFSVHPSAGQAGDVRAVETDVAPALSRVGEAEQSDRGLKILGGAEPSDYCVRDPLPDGQRYAGCGDAVTRNVAQWIGRRLLERA